MIIVTSSIFEKFRFQIIFCSQENAKPAFSSSSRLKRVFKKLRFHDGLVSTADLTVEIKIGFRISSPQCGLGLR